MQAKIDEVRKAIEYGLYNCALALALTLPDICAFSEYNDVKNKRIPYVNWFDKYAKPFFASEATALPDNKKSTIFWITGEDCWNLRCAVLHAGNFKCKDGQVISLHVHSGNTGIHNHAIKDEDYLEYELIDLCLNICNAVEKYYTGNKEKVDSVNENVRLLMW